MIYMKSINNSNEKRLQFNAPKGIADAFITILFDLAFLRAILADRRFIVNEKK